VVEVNADAPRRISEDYRRLQQQLHENPAYGVASLQFAPIVKRVVEQLGSASISDYGAGKKHLDRALRELGVALDYRPYDPAFPEYGSPRSADLVCCIDVLEHIEPEYLDNVLDELAKITVRHGFFSIHTGPAMKHLADGRNAHLIQQPSSWWLPKLCARLEIDALQKTAGGFFVIVSPLATAAAA
jgi:hypothetical protein